MVEFEVVLRRWGRSFGIVVLMEKIRKTNMMENEKIEVVLTKEENPLKKHFRTHKFSRPKKEILNEGNKERGMNENE